MSSMQCMSKARLILQLNMQSGTAKCFGQKLHKVLRAFRLIESSTALLVAKTSGPYKDLAPAITAALICATPIAASAEVLQGFPFLIEAHCPPSHLESPQRNKSVTHFVFKDLLFAIKDSISLQITCANISCTTLIEAV